MRSIPLLTEGPQKACLASGSEARPLSTPPAPVAQPWGFPVSGTGQPAVGGSLRVEKVASGESPAPPQSGLI